MPARIANADRKQKQVTSSPAEKEIRKKITIFLLLGRCGLYLSSELQPTSLGLWR